MPNAILVSKDLTKGRYCSMVVARQLLEKGLARIIRFYPYTLQLKNLSDPNDKEPLEDDHFIPDTPKGSPPSLLARLSLRKIYAQKESLKIFKHSFTFGKKPARKSIYAHSKNSLVSINETAEINC